MRILICRANFLEYISRVTPQVPMINEDGVAATTNGVTAPPLSANATPTPRKNLCQKCAMKEMGYNHGDHHNGYNGIAAAPIETTC